MLNLEPSRDNLDKLSVVLLQDEEWADDFVELGGVEALSDLLGPLEQKTIKEPDDFEMMGQVLIIQTHAIIIGEYFARLRSRSHSLISHSTRCCAACGC